MNYNVDHNYLKEPLFENLKGSRKYCTWLLLSFIRHWTRWNKTNSVMLYQGQYAKDIGVNRATLRDCLNHLIELGEVKCIKPYQRLGNQPGIYSAKRLVSRDPKVGIKSDQGRLREDMVNNSKELLKQSNSFLDKRITSKLKEEDPQRFAELVYLESLKKKQNKDR